MAKLPDPNTLQRTTPKAVQSNARIRPGVYTPAPADTSFAEAIGSASKDLFNYGLSEKARLDDVALQDAKNKYLEARMDEEAEYLSVRGKSAFDTDMVSVYGKRLDSVAAGVSSGLLNDAQKSAWDKFYAQDRVAFSSSVMKHKINESDRYSSDTYNSTNSVRVKDSYVNYADTARVDANARAITENVAKEAVRTGWSQDKITEALQKNLGALWANVAFKHIEAKDYAGAEALLDKHSSVIPETTLSKHRAAITTKRDQDRVLDGVSTLYAANQDPTAKQIRATAESLFKDEALRKSFITEAKAIKVANDASRAEKEYDANQFIAGQFLTQGVEDMEKVIMTSDASNTAKLSWKNAWDAKRTTSKPSSNLAKRALLRTRANSDPANLTFDEVWSGLFSKDGLTDTDAQSIWDLRNKNLKSDDTPGKSGAKTNLALAHKVIQRYKEVGHQLSEDVEENETTWIRFHDDLNSEYEKHQAAGTPFDAVSWAEEKYIVPAKENAAWRAVKDFAFDAYTSLGGALDPTEDDATEFLRRRGKVVNKDTVEKALEFLRGDK